jgi:hypothetical protein
VNDCALKASGDVNGVLRCHGPDAKRWKSWSRIRTLWIKKVSHTNLHRGCRWTRWLRRGHCSFETKVQGKLEGRRLVAAREIVVEVWGWLSGNAAGLAAPSELDRANSAIHILPVNVCWSLRNVSRWMEIHFGRWCKHCILLPRPSPPHLNRQGITPQ